MGIEASADARTGRRVNQTEHPQTKHLQTRYLYHNAMQAKWLWGTFNTREPRSNKARPNR